ncbi:hypothetical protein AB6A40_011097 [Gnathostoma spinigerum]|uniref:Uncharacterized protein n=1 Tax=Gnathostoma spinigerum TaxID=75299 RepID=A0ABD6F2Y2_9BILA
MSYLAKRNKPKGAWSGSSRPLQILCSPEVHQTMVERTRLAKVKDCSQHFSIVDRPVQFLKLDKVKGTKISPRGLCREVCRLSETIVCCYGDAGNSGVTSGGLIIITFLQCYAAKYCELVF